MEAVVQTHVKSGEDACCLQTVIANVWTQHSFDPPDETILLTTLLHAPQCIHQKAINGMDGGIET